MKPRITRFVGGLALLGVTSAVASACVGDLDAGPIRPGDPRPTPGPEPVCMDPSPGAAPLRRLTETQWQATLDGLFGAGTSTDVPFPRALYRRGYRTDAVLGEVSRDGAVTLADSASDIAERVVPEDVATLLGCTPTASETDACIGTYVDDLGSRAFRRPVRDDERVIFTSLYADLVIDEALSVREGVIGVVEAILASPQLHYLTVDLETEEDGVIRLPDHGVAERLSYFLWNEPPDATLRTAAEEGRLGTREDVEIAARRMVEDPRTTTMMVGFVEDWLELHRVRGMTKDPATFPAWAGGMQSSIASEHGLFVTEVMNDDARLETLLSADFAVVDAQLASLYGTATPAMGTTSGRASLGPERRGILNLSGFLAGHAGATEPAPVLRGVTVIRQVLCEDMELPVGLAVTSPPQDPTRTTRQRFTAHRADPVCAGCHDRIDPIGFAFEDFDAVGAHRETDENDLDVDASGRVRSFDGALDVPVNGGASVSDALATSSVVRSCFARQVFGYAEGRVLSRIADDAEIDDCAIDQITARFAESDGDIRELLVAIATSEAFRARRIR